MTCQGSQRMALHPDFISHLIIQCYNSVQSKVITAQIIRGEGKCRQPLQHKPVLLDIPPLPPSSSLLLLISQHLSKMLFSFMILYSAYLSGGLKREYVLQVVGWKWHLRIRFKTHYC